VNTLLARAGLGRRAGFLIPSRGQTIVGRLNGGDLMRRLLCSLALALGCTSGEAADLPGPIAIRAPIQAENPCGDANVLTRIAQRFAWAERNTWHRGFIMASLANGRESGHPYFEPGLIRRDYCVADSVMTNGSAHSVFYAIEYDVGFASIGNYVDFCVLGLDPWHIHDEACRTVR
jgi:hypothetical protein